MATSAKIRTTKAPALPFAPVEYAQKYQDDFANILRLYFTQLDSTLAALLDTAGGASLTLPAGAFFQDGATTLVTNITNASNPPNGGDIVVNNVDGFVLTSGGGIIIESEIIKYTSIDVPNKTFKNITRGAYGSSASGHAVGSAVTEAQTLASPSVAIAVALLQTTTTNGVALDATDKTKVVFSIAGVYNIQFSIQMLTYDGTIDNVTIWFRLNGVDIPYSAGVATVPAVHAGKPGTAIISWNLIQPVNPGDYIQLLFASDTGNTVAATYPAGTSPVHPISPSIILTATFASALP